jgi:hypothetical protein
MSVEFLISVQILARNDRHGSCNHDFALGVAENYMDIELNTAQLHGNMVSYLKFKLSGAIESQLRPNLRMEKNTSKTITCTEL